jgi:hypothetical protein
MKLSKMMIKVVTQLIKTQMHLEYIRTRVANKCEYLPNYFRKPDEFYKGELVMNYATLENILHMHNIYEGYNDRTFTTCLLHIDITIQRYYGAELLPIYEACKKEYCL